MTAYTTLTLDAEEAKTLAQAVKEEIDRLNAIIERGEMPLFQSEMSHKVIVLDRLDTMLSARLAVLGVL